MSEGFKIGAGISIIIILIIGLIIGLTSFEKVKPGYVGVKINMFGSKKGVQPSPLEPGLYFTPPGVEIMSFPTTTISYVWTKNADEGSPNDESITFQTEDGMTLNGDFGITYSIIPAKAPLVYQKYRRGVEEITDIYIRNMVRDAFTRIASDMTVEEAYSNRKIELLDKAKKELSVRLDTIGIQVQELSLLCEMRLPAPILASINAKIEATQNAIRTENELRSTEAEANKSIAEAEGYAKAKIIEARGEAEANRILTSSINELILKKMDVENQRLWIEKWNGSLPTTTLGEQGFMLNLK